LNPAKLKQTFSASQYVQASQDIVFPERLTTRAQWIVGRSQCLFRSFATSNFPSKNREEALALQVRRWAPFPEPGFHANWTKETVEVWAWDQEKVKQNVEEIGVQPISVLPESVYYPQLTDTSARWIESIDDGVIFQLWVNGDLVAEKWFSKRPKASRFLLFLRSLTLPNSTRMDWVELKQICENAPEAGQLELLPAPWGTKNKTWSLVQKLPWEHSMLLGMAGLLLIAYVWVLTATAVASISLEQVKSRTASIEESVEAVLDARTTAETLNTESEALLVLVDYPSQSMMMVDVSSVLQPFSLILKGWDFKGKTLEIVTEGNVNTLNVVKQFEQFDWIQSVSVSALRNQGQNRFVITLEPTG
jgi:hypothetical protein